MAATALRLLIAVPAVGSAYLHYTVCVRLLGCQATPNVCPCLQHLGRLVLAYIVQHLALKYSVTGNC